MYVFVAGPIAMLTLGAGLTWLANPILFISWVKYKTNSKTSFYCSAISTIISLSFLMFDEVIAEEAGNFQRISSYKIGYWLWVASSVTILTGNVLSRLGSNSRDVGGKA